MKYKLFEASNVLLDYHTHIYYHHDGLGRSWENSMEQRRAGVAGVWLTDQLVVSQLFRVLVDEI